MKRLAYGPEATRALGRELSLALPENSVIGLCGDLGAGKTEFVKGIAEGLGSIDPVTSPTFALVHEYRSGRVPLFHMDFYRLETEKELDEIGFDDYLRQYGICAIEWADRFPDRIPRDAIRVEIQISSGNERLIVW
jgi:tRNA threonylcarbamoyladenosine biosynthesis protein TsaE